MSIENRNVAVGTRLVAKYKGLHYEVVFEGGDPSPYHIDVALERDLQGRTFKSPSSAGMAVRGGKAVNGWRFWTVEGDATATPPTPAEEKPARQKAPANARKVIYRYPNQRGVAQGSVRWFCTACMAGFIVDGDAEPRA